MQRDLRPELLSHCQSACEVLRFRRQKWWEIILETLIRKSGYLILFENSVQALRNKKMNCKNSSKTYIESQANLQTVWRNIWPAKEANISLVRLKPVFTKEQELILVGHALAMDDRFGFTPKGPANVGIPTCRAEQVTSQILSFVWYGRKGLAS